MVLDHESPCGGPAKVDGGLGATQQPVQNNSADARRGEVLLRHRAVKTQESADNWPVELPDNGSAALREHSCSPEGPRMDMLKVFEVEVLRQDCGLRVRNLPAILYLDHASSP